MSARGLPVGIVVASGMIVMVVGGYAASAAEENISKEPVTVKKTEEGLHFNVPADWPIEKRGGITAPIPIEEYLARKFKALESRLQTLEDRFNGFDVRLRVLEEDAKKRRQSLRSAEQPATQAASSTP